MTTPTAKSTALPLTANSLNSCNMPIAIEIITFHSRGRFFIE
jgi:hypothetical protein